MRGAPKGWEVRAIALSSYERTLALAAELHVRTPLLYDLLHCVCADAFDAAELWTFDLKDFTRLQSVTSARIVTPPPPASPAPVS